MKTTAIKYSLLAYTLGFASIVQAGIATATMAVSANVQASCSATANPLSFGDITPFSPTQTTSATVSVTCSSGTSWNPSLTSSTTGGGSFAMAKNGGGSNLPYYVYTDSNYSTPAPSGNWFSSYKASTDTSFTVYAKLLSSDIANADTASYSDTIIISIDYY